MSRTTHKRLPFERKRKRKREIFFFWTPKETKAPRGNFPSFPLGTPKLLIPPQTKSEAQSYRLPPCLRGQGESLASGRIWVQVHVKRQGGDDKQCVFLQLRRGAENRSARVAILTFRCCQGREKFCRQSLANFFGVVP